MKIYSRFLITLAVTLTATLCLGCSSQSANAENGQKLSTDNKQPVSTTAGQVQFTDEENKALDAVVEDKVLEFLGKTFDQTAAEEKYEYEKTNPDVYDNPNCDETIENKLVLTHLMLNENLFNRLLYADSFTFNFNSLVNDGLMAIIPRNPYTGDDIASNLDYTPGDCFLACDGRGLVFIYHTGEKEMEFEPDRTDHTLLTYQIRDRQPGFYSDGRSLIVCQKFSSGEYSELLNASQGMKGDFFHENNNPEYIKIYWLHRQVFEIMSRYSQMNEDVLPSLGDYIDYYGRINPVAWMNPYTGEPMQKVGFAGKCDYFVSQDMTFPDSPVPSKYISPKTDKSYYAGNYSFESFTDEKGPIAIFAIYYLKSDGNLGALFCRAVPKSRFMEETWGK